MAAADARILKLLPPRKRDTFLSVLHDMGRAEVSPAASEAAVKAPKTKKKKKTKAAKAMKPAKSPKVEKAAKIEKAPKPQKDEAAGGKKKKARKADAVAETVA